MKVTKELRLRLNNLSHRTLRAWQRETANYLIAKVGAARIETLRDLCHQLSIYDVAHFTSNMNGFSRVTENGRVIAWYS